jgi:hypothetical protein
MRTPEWLRPGLWGAAIGAVAALVIGFNTDMLMLQSSAEKLAQNQSQAAVVTALTPICLQQVKNDPQRDMRLAALEDITSSWTRRDKVMDMGWATMPGDAGPNRDVAATCLDELVKSFKKK